ncbi:hypothetical protein [Actinoplanes awajinensis]|uniref:Uncharacterized protein n=1 Tax=Actinoplanes awajinensis subsp. mycoplanecinus TaxID=135947 RepID=A0A101JLC0_9ACTN|nr:hypothetical protein [Actinoplanes awajinensis]KUL28864.1 hypothetical protein ADL15_30665 [Actinoplanes awajinensis subsp. mycoplanecinus]
MTFEEAVEALLFPRPGNPGPDSSMERLPPTTPDRLTPAGMEGPALATCHAEFLDDPDHAYLVTVERVPRVRLPLSNPVLAAETHDGVRALLTDVAIANHVEVTLDAEATPATRAAVTAYRAAFEAWATSPDRDHPPSWPGETLMHLPVTVTDDLGTSYRMSSGHGGGDGAEWRAHHKFLPRPPAAARLLTIHLPAGATTFPLPGAP